MLILGVGVLGKPVLLLPPVSKLSLLLALPVNASRTSGLPLYGLPDPALFPCPKLLSIDPLLPLPVNGDPDNGERDEPRSEADDFGVADLE